MEPGDEFEFRPLTKGLGFQKKSIKLQEQVQRSGMVENALNKNLPLPPPDTDAVQIKDPNSVQTLEELLKALEKPLTSVPAATSTSSASGGVQMTQPLPRPETKKYQAMDMNIDINMDIPVPGPSKPPRGGFDIPLPGTDVTQRPVPRPEVGIGPKRGASDNPMARMRPATVNPQAAFLDGIVVTAVTLLFLVSLVLVTKIDILSVVVSAKTDITTQISLGLLYLAVMQMYVVVARSFYGRTLGEWTFDYQLGRDEDHTKALYPLQVAWRSLLMVLTGMILLPLISWIAGKDIAGRLTGIELYQLKGGPFG